MTVPSLQQMKPSRTSPLLDRHAFEDRLRQAVAQADRTGEQVALHVVRVGDDAAGAGRAVGDELAAVVRRADALAQLDDTTFGVLQRAVACGDAVAILARKLLVAADRGGCGAAPAFLGISLHLPRLPWQDLLARGEAALRKARSAPGRSCRYHIYRTAEAHEPEAQVRQIERLELALVRGEFFLQFQPQVGLGNAEVLAYEALLRWHHPERGDLTPETFLATAEGSGLIAELGHWVLEESCRQCRRWNEAWGTKIPVAVNMSALELCREGFAGRVIASLVRIGLEPKLLELELTESFCFEDAPHIHRELRLLLRHGVRLVVDDFGMGFASLRYLRRFPVHKVKIPRELIGDAAPDEMDKAIIEAIVQIGRRLGMQVIAEGIETVAQLAAVRALGCAGAQGHLLGRPGVPAWPARLGSVTAPIARVAG